MLLTGLPAAWTLKVLSTISQMWTFWEMRTAGSLPKIPVCNAGPPSHNPSVRSKGVAKGPVFQVLYLGGVGVTDAICKMW